MASSVLSRKFACIRSRLRAARCVALGRRSDGYASLARLASGPQARSRCTPCHTVGLATSTANFRDRTLEQPLALEQPEGQAGQQAQRQPGGHAGREQRLAGEGLSGTAEQEEGSDRGDAFGSRPGETPVPSDPEREGQGQGREDEDEPGTAQAIVVAALESPSL